MTLFPSLLADAGWLTDLTQVKNNKPETTLLLISNSVTQLATLLIDSEKQHTFYRH